MNIDKIKEVLLKRDGLSNTLGMEFISTPDPDTCQARMKVDERNRQIFGFLCGGARRRHRDRYSAHSAQRENAAPVACGHTQRGWRLDFVGRSDQLCDEQTEIE